MRETVTLDSGQVLSNVHPEGQCLGDQCPIHRQSEHAKGIGPQYWREDRGIMERICAHGIGHPDPDASLPEFESVHGCDGCCGVPR